MKKTNKGFTILEILVVLSVIAILIGIAIPRFKGMQDEANIQKAKAELKSIQAAVESYKNQHSAYPATKATKFVEDVLSAEAVKLVDSGIYDPFAAASTEYIYTRSADGKFYVISSLGVASDATAVTVADTTGAVGKVATQICVTNGTGC